MSTSDLGLDIVANQSAQQHIIDTLEISDRFPAMLVEMAVEDYNNGGNGFFRTGYFPISRAARKQLKSYTAHQVEVAIKENLLKHEDISRVSVFVITSPFWGVKQYFTIDIRIP